MSRIILVHGAFNELWGPHELKARWLPALRDGLWHNNVEIDAEEVSVCFYGDLFRRTPGTDEDKVIEQSRAGIADALTNLAGEDAVAALSQAASDAAFDRTVDMVTIMATNSHLREQMRGRIEPLVSGETKVVVACECRLRRRCSRPSGRCRSESCAAVRAGARRPLRTR